MVAKFIRNDNELWNLNKDYAFDRNLTVFDAEPHGESPHPVRTITTRPFYHTDGTYSVLYGYYNDGDISGSINNMGVKEFDLVIYPVGFYDTGKKYPARYDFIYLTQYVDL